MRTLNNADRAVMEDMIAQTLMEFTDIPVADAVPAANEALSRLMLAFPEVFEGCVDEDDCEAFDSEDQYDTFDDVDDPSEAELELD